jgi:uncharacterized protein
MTQFGFPYGVGLNGRTADADAAAHARDLIELVLFTGQGERVNRPDFGSSANQLVFAGNSPELATALEFLVKASLQRWLGDVLTVESLTVAAADATLRIDLRYRLVTADTVSTLTLQRGV